MGDVKILDVRELIPRERHSTIFEEFDGLAAGDAFELVNDHDPKPLYYQLMAERPGQLGWEYMEQGPDVWRVRMTKKSAGNVVDVRTIPPFQRHPLLFQTFDDLAVGESFELVNDHDPKPLYYQFSAERPGQLQWEYLEQGPAVFRIRLTKQAEG